jgi:hypothetical protein
MPPIRQEKLSCTDLRWVGAGKSPKMLWGYAQRDDKVFGKIGLLWQEN